MDSFGNPIIRQDDLIRSHVAYLDKIDKEIREYLRSPNSNGATDCRQKLFPVIHLSGYCQDRVMSPVNIVPAEYAMGYFSLAAGISDDDHMSYGFINPVECPVGLRADVMEQCKIRKLPMINEHKSVGEVETTPEQFLMKLDAMLSKKDLDLNVVKRTTERYVFTAKNEVHIVSRIIKWCQAHVTKTDDNDRLFIKYTVLPLATVLRLLSELVSAENKYIKLIPHDADAGTIIDHHKYMYVDRMSCKWHEKLEGSEFCCLNIVRRMMYNVLRFFSKFLNIETKVPSHMPYQPAGDEESFEVQFIPFDARKPHKGNVGYRTSPN